MVDRRELETEVDQPQPSDVTLEQGILMRFEDLGLIDEPAMACTLLDTFLESCRDLHARLEESIQASDPQHCRDVAHTLKGSSRSIGAARLGDLWFDLQRVADAGDLSEARAIQASALGEFERVEAFLLEMRDDLDTSGT